LKVTDGLTSGPPLFTRLAQYISDIRQVSIPWELHDEARRNGSGCDHLQPVDPTDKSVDEN
jgi:hypothetical protein